MPPMSSTIRSEPWRISSKSPRLRVSTPTTSGRRTTVASIASARSSTSSANAEPTVPWPSRPTLKLVTGGQVLVGLVSHDDSGVAGAAEDHRRAGHAVVVVGHRVPVGAGGRRDEHVPGPRVVQVHV